MDLSDFNADLTFTSYYPFREKCANEKQRRHLESVIRHAKGEVQADLDNVLPTLMPDPQYHEYGVFVNTSEDLGPKGMDAVRANYEEMVNNGSYVIESIKHRVVMSDDQIVTEGTYRQILNRDVARKMGFTQVDEDDHEFYLLFARTIVFWDFDENDLCSEDRYVTGHKLVAIEESDLPAHYPAHLRKTAGV